MVQLGDFIKNRPAIILQIGEALKQIMQAIKMEWSSMCLHIFRTGKLLFCSDVCVYRSLMAGVFIMKPFIRMFRDTGRAYQFCMLISAGLSLLVFFLCKSYGAEAASDSMQFGLLFVVFIINGIFTGTYYSFTNVMTPATVDYGEWKNGKG